MSANTLTRLMALFNIANIDDVDLIADKACDLAKENTELLSKVRFCEIHHQAEPERSVSDAADER